MFYGYKIGMSKNEIRFSKYGEILDLIACNQIESGNLLPKKKKLKFEDVMKMK